MDDFCGQKFLILNLVKDFYSYNSSSLSYEKVLLMAREHNITKARLEIMFPCGLQDILDHYFTIWNKELLIRLDDAVFSGLSFSKKISFLIGLHLEIATQDGLLFAAMANYYKKNISKATLRCYDMADFIIKNAKDVSMDFNYYTKRATLSLIYARVVLYWVRKQDLNLTKDFINAQIARAKNIGIIKKAIKEKISTIKEWPIVRYFV